MTRVEQETGRGGEFIGARANVRDCKSDRSVAGSTQAARAVCLKRSDGWGQDGLRRRKVDKWSVLTVGQLVRVDCRLVSGDSRLAGGD